MSFRFFYSELLVLVDWLSIYFMVVVQSWMSTKITMTNGIKIVQQHLRTNIKLLQS